MSTTSSNPAHGLDRQQARVLALEAGFAEAGIVALPHLHQSRDATRFEEWLRAGRAGTMQYLARINEQGQPVRSRVAIPFPWARSAIVCFANYHAAHPLSTAPATEDAGWIARYAWSSRTDASGVRRPSDYHKVLLKRLRAMEARLREQFGAFESRAYVDTGPVVERALATAAGLGWSGKNTCLIHPQLGSFGFSGGAADVNSSRKGESASRAGARPLRKLPPLPGRLPYRRADRSLPDGCHTLHLLPDHRAPRPDLRRS